MIKFQQYLLNENKDLDQQLINAARDGDVDFVKKLVNQGADIYINNNAVLKLASQFGYLEIIKYLIGKGADIHTENDYALRYNL
jgi:ankyrin repeat protein